MGIRSDLEARAKEIFSSRWEKRDGIVVPTDSGIALGNEGVKLKATVLYADLSGSTNLVDKQPPDFAAEVYKSFLHCAAKIINSEGGEITAYDGDRIMAVFIGNRKNTSAARAALKINWAVANIINPEILEFYGADKYTVKQVVGIDTSDLLVAKTGVRGANDLVWVGRAANYAAKLSSLDTYSTYITDSVYKVLAREAKYAQTVDMWRKLTWTPMNKMTIYGTTYSWELQD